MTRSLAEPLTTDAVPQTHVAQFYQDTAHLARVVSEFLMPAIKQGTGAALIATPEHCDAFKRQMEASGACVASLQESGQLVVLDARTTLEALSMDGKPSQQRFDEIVGPMFKSGGRQFPITHAYGEMVDLLWQDGCFDEAGLLESFWNGLIRENHFSLLCAYRIDDLDPDSYRQPLRCICESHSRLLPSPTLVSLETKIMEASHAVMGPTIAGQVGSLAEAHPPSTVMHASQATLFYLAENMPRLTERLLRQIRSA